MRILIADDEKSIRDSIAEYLELDGHEVMTAENGLSALRLLEDEYFDVFVTDLKMPAADGLEVLGRMKAAGIDVPVIMISAFGDVADAVEAMKLGAEDYLVKPFETEELMIKVLKAGEKRRLLFEVERLRSKTGSSVTMESRNDVMKRILKLARKAAPTPSNVLITGESGTGKEVLARFMHTNSNRADKPFVAVNVGSIPESLMESELYGHEKGAFTGADRMKTGLFEAGNGGTVFLDEIGEMPVHLQVKLLRTLQERSVQRVGSVRQIKLDVRIIAATNRSLEEEVEAGRFREDLFYRLNVVRIHLPPLRERLEDLPELCASFVTLMNVRMGRNISGISSSALEGLKCYSFPGNIRELENLIERAFILAEGDFLEVEDFSLPVSNPELSKGVGTLKQIEKQAIQEALARWEGKKTKTAEELGIDRKTLFNKIKEYGLD
ncbi:MAG: sigma-54 dependent transcriptional regulator [Spirochaetales bacterium]|uniref:Sigma-54 dependent transcriptional regulator n=1 Tax=Candidatus Thalassospirochaeta sargassi TaxID=3119039 RepID=A0AAJ1IHK5_9SPIO|nr:sigma-54 dependent transcriptional regulator [Spirochaetales bacterium]